MTRHSIFLLLLVFLFYPLYNGHADTMDINEDRSAMDMQQTEKRLRTHLESLTVAIGERSVRVPKNLDRAASYITSFYEQIGVRAHAEPYSYNNLEVSNIVAEISSGAHPSHRYIVGGHYDSVSGTVGADDNASAIAVQLETARSLKAMFDQKKESIWVLNLSLLPWKSRRSTERPIWAAGCMPKKRARPMKKSPV